ncbi:MAG: amidohydrolase family protein [Verrucomicrobiia bacterium]
MKVIDTHVHIVGNGSAETGCRLKTPFWRWPMSAFMARHIGLPVRALQGDLDRLYIRQLKHWVRTSSLDAVVILAQERVYSETGERLSRHDMAYVPNEYVLALAREHPEFLPAVSIHPARPDAMEELERCLDGGAVMMKCLPVHQNIDCRDRRYGAFWKRMADAGLPLLAHTGGEHTLPVVRPDLSDPRVLELPLECGVTVIAAHCGTKSAPFDRQFFPVFTEMVKRYPNLYGDNSAFTVPIRGDVALKCLEKPLVDRIIHGSDYPVPVFGHWPWMKGFVDWQTFRKWQHQPNPLERDYQLKRAMGFPAETFTRVNQLLRQAKPPPSPAGSAE